MLLCEAFIKKAGPARARARCACSARISVGGAFWTWHCALVDLLPCGLANFIPQETGHEFCFWCMWRWSMPTDPCRHYAAFIHMANHDTSRGIRAGAGACALRVEGGRGPPLTLAMTLTLTLALALSHKHYSAGARRKYKA